MESLDKCATLRKSITFPSSMTRDQICKESRARIGIWASGNKGQYEYDLRNMNVVGGEHVTLVYYDVRSEGW